MSGAPAALHPALAVIFDFDGVIADTEWLHFETFAGVLEEAGIRIDASDHGERFLGINDRAGFRKAFVEAGREISAAEVEALVERKSVHYRRRLGEVRPFPGVKELLASLAARAPLAIASGGRSAEIEVVLGAHGLRGFFRALLSADEVARSKPAPDVYLETLAALRRAAPDRAAALTPGECLVIEDSLPGIRAAKAAGMRCIAVAHTYPRAMLAEADGVVEKVADLDPRQLLGEPSI